MTTEQATNNITITTLRRRSNKEFAKVLNKMITLWVALGPRLYYGFSAEKVRERMGITRSAANKVVEMGMDTGILSNGHDAMYSFTRTGKMLHVELEELNDN